MGIDAQTVFTNTSGKSWHSKSFFQKMCSHLVSPGDLENDTHTNGQKCMNVRLCILVPTKRPYLAYLHLLIPGQYHAYVRLRVLVLILPGGPKLNFCVFCVRTVLATWETTDQRTHRQLFYTSFALLG